MVQLLSRSGFGLLIFVVALTVPGFGQDQRPEDETQFKFYGFGRTNMVWDDRDLKRSDLFMPANIQVGGPKNQTFFLGAKQTRIGFDVKQKLGEESLTIKLEGDFHNDASDATGLLRMRLAYAEYKFVMVGMNWSNFFDIEANPITVDFEGPNSSTFSRTPQVRFFTFRSKNTLSLSLENPMESITVVPAVTVLPERFPDLIAAYRINGEFGFVKIAALLREIRYDTDRARSLPGYGLTVLSSLKIGSQDKLRFQAVTGTGVSKYILGSSGLNYDAIYDGTNELVALQMHGSYFSYQHFWSDHAYSSLTAGWLGVNNSDLLSADDYKQGYYGSINYFWQAVKNLTFGAEVVAGERVNIDKEKGAAVRVQMSATYNFSKNF